MTAAARPCAISTLIWYLISSYHLIYFRSFNLRRARYANCPNYTKVGEWHLQTACESGLGAATASSQDLLLHDAMELLLQSRLRHTPQTKYLQPSTGKQMMFFMCDFYFSSPFSMSFFFSSVLSSCWQQQTLYFDELINISPGSKGAPACSASPCFMSD